MALNSRRGQPDGYLKKAESVREKLVAMKLPKAAELVSEGIHETLSYYAFPQEHWRRIRTNNPLERINREIRRRTKVVGCFPDGRSALMLVAARLRHIAGTKWGTKRYLDISLLSRQKVEMEHAAQSLSDSSGGWRQTRPYKSRFPPPGGRPQAMPRGAKESGSY